MALLVFAGRTASAQTISINSVSGSTFCGGDPVSVSFTVTGFWQHNNAFTLQLSDPSGSFTNGFSNLSSIKDTLPGTFTFSTAAPKTAVASTHYRVRVIGALPYVESADNGSDLAIGQAPHLGLEINSITGVGMPLVALTTPPAYEDNTVLLDTFYWNLGDGGVPADTSGVGLWALETDSSSGTPTIITYSTAGTKTVTVRVVTPEGCSATATGTVHVFDCSSPVIPHDAHVIDTNATVYYDTTAIWVNPGVTVYVGGGGDTIFAESGSTITYAGGENIIYLKPGAVLNNGGGNIVIFATGANPSHPAYQFSCPSLTFDYSTAPPNKAMGPLAVQAPSVPISVTLSPNPSTGTVQISGMPDQAREISVLDVLGKTVIDFEHSAPTMTLDLSKHPKGTYYFRFLVGTTVTTKAIVLE